MLELVARLLQDAGDRLRARRVALAAVQNVADPLAAPVGVRLLQEQDRSLGDVGEARASRATATPLLETGGTELVELAPPVVERVVADPDEGSEVLRRKTAPLPRIEDEDPLLGGQRLRRQAILRPDEPLPAPSRGDAREFTLWG